MSNADPAPRDGSQAKDSGWAGRLKPPWHLERDGGKKPALLADRSDRVILLTGSLCDRNEALAMKTVPADCVFAPDEIPNLPHVDVDQAKKYALAKSKEAVAHVRGG